MITRAWYDIQGRKYIDVNGIRIKVPFRYNRVTGVDIQGHVPIQDISVGTQVKVTTRKVQWDGLEYYVLKSICPMSKVHCPVNEVHRPSPGTESQSSQHQT